MRRPVRRLVPWRRDSAPSGYVLSRTALNPCATCGRPCHHAARACYICALAHPRTGASP